MQYRDMYHALQDIKTKKRLELLLCIPLLLYKRKEKNFSTKIENKSAIQVF